MLIVFLVVLTREILFALFVPYHQCVQEDLKVCLEIVENLELRVQLVNRVFGVLLDYQVCEVVLVSCTYITTGSIGHRGVRGTPGNKGSKGVSGTKGAVGLRGPPGRQGRPGNMGVPGECIYGKKVTIAAWIEQNI